VTPTPTMITVAWTTWVIGSFGVGFCAAVAILYLRHWRFSTGPRSMLLPFHVGVTALGFTCLSVYVVGSSYWMVELPRWLRLTGLAGVLIVSVGLGVAWAHVMRRGPMYWQKR
jgi:hypothetical protein